MYGTIYVEMLSVVYGCRGAGTATIVVLHMASLSLNGFRPRRHFVVFLSPITLFRQSKYHHRLELRSVIAFGEPPYADPQDCLRHSRCRHFDHTAGRARAQGASCGGRCTRSREWRFATCLIPLSCSTRSDVPEPEGRAMCEAGDIVLSVYSRSDACTDRLLSGPSHMAAPLRLPLVTDASKMSLCMLNSSPVDHLWSLGTSHSESDHIQFISRSHRCRQRAY